MARPSNHFLVGANGDRVSVVRPTGVMSKDEALNLAAWIVALADPLGDKFPALLEAVKQ